MWPFPAGSSPIKPSVYGFWIGAYSDEPPSWYYAKVEKHYLTGQTKIEYSDLSTEHQTFTVYDGKGKWN